MQPFRACPQDLSTGTPIPLFRLWREDLCEKEEVLLKSSRPNDLAAKIAHAERGLDDEDEEMDEDDEDADDDE